jgi:hypothetical protein
MRTRFLVAVGAVAGALLATVGLRKPKPDVWREATRNA